MTKQRISVRSRTDLENVLGYKFRNPDLLRQALTHASAINEKHPEAFNRDLLPLAFVGDAVLKYAVARYLFLNGKEDVMTSSAELHDGTQSVITNGVLAKIANEKLYIEQYLVRGNSHQTLNKNMYADCMEAIFGAIALDCRIDQQEMIFAVIERLCSQCYQRWLDDIRRYRFLSASEEDEDEWITDDIITWPKGQLNSVMHGYRPTTVLQQRSFSQLFGQGCLWLFALLGFIALCCVVVGGIIIARPTYVTKNLWNEL